VSDDLLHAGQRWSPVSLGDFATNLSLTVDWKVKWSVRVLAVAWVSSQCVLTFQSNGRCTVATKE